jgi:hypothetical protein
MTYLVSVAPQRDTKGTCKTKVGQFQGAVLVNEEVLGFQVPVQDPARVAVIKAFNQLVEIALQGRSRGMSDNVSAGRIGQVTNIVPHLDEVRRQAGGGCRVHVLFQIQIQKLENEVQLGIIMDNVFQAVGRFRDEARFQRLADS